MSSAHEIEKNVKLTIPVSEELRKEIKLHAIKTSKTLKDYVIRAVVKQMEKDDKNEDKYWSKQATKAEKQGFIGKEKSSQLMEKLKNATD